MKLKEILKEAKSVKVTKQWWKKASEEEREQAMLSVVKDPDDINILFWLRRKNNEALDAQSAMICFLEP